LLIYSWGLLILPGSGLDQFLRGYTMPIYEYACNDCGHKLEAIQKLSEAPLKDCPDCGQGALRKLVSAAGFRLKGSGWYETDFKTGAKKEPSASPKEPSASADCAGGGCAAPSD
jgi:putative FmdB family regulatory protein